MQNGVDRVTLLGYEGIDIMHSVMLLVDSVRRRAYALSPACLIGCY